MSEREKRKSSLYTTEELRVVGIAEKLQKRYKFSERFDLSEEHTDLFNNYLIAYLVLQTDRNGSDLLKRPEAEVIAKLPGFRGMISFLEKIEKAKEEISKEYFNKADMIVCRMRESVDKEALNVLARIGDMDIKEVKKRLGVDNPELQSLANLILRKVGSPTAIKNAANLISSTYTFSVDKTKIEQDMSMEAVLRRIKIKEEINKD